MTCVNCFTCSYIKKVDIDRNAYANQFLQRGRRAENHLEGQYVGVFLGLTFFFFFLKRCQYRYLMNSKMKLNYLMTKLKKLQETDISSFFGDEISSQKIACSLLVIAWKSGLFWLQWSMPVHHSGGFEVVIRKKWEVFILRHVAQHRKDAFPFFLTVFMIFWGLCKNWEKSFPVTTWCQSMWCYDDAVVLQRCRGATRVLWC